METLIINKRRELPKAKRIFWDGITVLLWLGFLYLWKPVFLIFYKIITLGAPADEIADWIFGEIHSVTFEHAIIVLITTPIVLFILSRLNRHQAPSEHLLYDAKDYADYFDLDDTNLQQCTNSQLVTVYHDTHGHIIRLNDQITTHNQ
ncbi:MAG TPA: poly-beta-1,6-N-acetyl-D-glucosamine biosynthesis protein PgaD [Sulfuricurvum sp.]|nr:MAG: poly-beta-1,6-N-acetyl-D-glucosamine biosynthesis protein PgaD [Campylobacterales bacterium 16-40-21]OZA02966.1 MAG: poly-beta-1,6-N-acetyl-D-glucosamine biosynthesis protein PgaD [Sulfuricurvum sp. 17-40-25]HQS66952.1 poly-beta-1,6-N-acetyl-D-glucosamine biosynthesis protein PgaD [Sulfuricurvum sp.]HQT36805.1 poly-beta-1,6-N-acetyl-D-glucosamine biosynthesis protein PgaD [Sulfuricurvum sp.]